MVGSNERSLLEPTLNGGLYLSFLLEPTILGGVYSEAYQSQLKIWLALLQLGAFIGTSFPQAHNLF